jgi:hypothetical protein
VFSRTHKYAGTADVIARMKIGKDIVPVIIDIKTSKAIYDDVALQLCAYARADFVGMEDGSEEPLVPDGEKIRYGVVVRPTASGTYEHAVFGLDDGVFALFLSCLFTATNREKTLRAARRRK